MVSPVSIAIPFSPTQPLDVLWKPGLSLYDALMLTPMADQVQEAADAVNAWTRARMREDGFYRSILPPVPITNEELDRCPR